MQIHFALSFNILQSQNTQNNFVSILSTVATLGGQESVENENFEIICLSKIIINSVSRLAHKNG